MMLDDAALEGLSPRVRGSRCEIVDLFALAGSIPAGAGEPHRRRGAGGCARVYPRGCGGAPLQNPQQDFQTGLSPRVRGSRQTQQRVLALEGSIPAGAGEPKYSSRRGYLKGVYPRGCGGARISTRRAHNGVGLSPRVRGSPASTILPGMVLGSIPAGAGEPPRCSASLAARGVYPRGCGGAGCAPHSDLLCPGLSPRVRGSRLLFSVLLLLEGSIPAGAGEPDTSPTSGASTRVYPRGCGGAVAPSNHAARETGLSPRVRGSRRRCQLGRGADGSIPAGAGEPKGGFLSSH